MFALRKLKVGARLAAGFGLLLLLIVAILGVVLYGNSRTSAQFERVVDVNMVKMRMLNSMLNTNNNTLMLRRLMLIKRGADFEQDYAQAQGFTAAYDKTWAEFVVIPRDAIGDRMVEEIKQSRVLADESTAKLDAFMREGDFDAAIDVLLNELRPRAMAWNAAIADLAEHQNELAAASRATYLEAADRTRLLVVVIGALSIILGALAALFITRSLTQPLSAAVRVADGIAGGRLDNVLDTTATDEPGVLARSMQRMQQQVKSVIAAQAELARQHDAGAISFRMDESAFPGDYGTMVRSTNALVASHLGTIQQSLEILKRYSIGDFSLDMRRLPGEKAVMTETIDGIKANLSDINDEIKRLATAAAAGDFTQRGDEAHFQYNFREMVAGLNRLMEVTDGNLAELSSLLQAIARGDLTARMEGDFHGVFARMRDDANATVAQLTSIISRIQAAADSISLAAGEIASGNADLSRRTEQQAANLEETAASMEELTSTVRQNAEHARQANQLAIGAHGVASQGGQVVGQVVTTMSAIEASSKKIADIISVIDGIAFQTNILALNAAVEAARAGEQGRGFAVVASEVRSLAQRSAGAAKEIKTLIDDSVEKVSEGSALVNQAGSTMGEIVTSVQRVTDIMAEISAASQEQSSGIEQVNQTVTQMDETTQQNAALVEEATAAARSMEEQASQLMEAVAVFRVAGQAAAAAPVRQPAAPAPAKRPQRRPTARAKVDAVMETEADAEWQEF